MILCQNSLHEWEKGLGDEGLFLQFIRFHDLLVGIRIVHTQVVQNLASLCNFAKEASAGGFIFRVFLQMFHEQIDFFTQERDLDLGRTSVLLVSLMLANEFLLKGSGEHEYRIENEYRQEILAGGIQESKKNKEKGL